MVFVITIQNFELWNFLNGFYSVVINLKKAAQIGIIDYLKYWRFASEAYLWVSFEMIYLCDTKNGNGS